MTKMTVAWLMIYFVCLFRAFIDPTYGLIGYEFEYYLRPALHWWGVPLPDLRWNMVISVVAIIAYLINRAALPKQREIANAALPFLLVLLGMMLVLTPVAASVDRSYARFILFSKIVIIYFLVSQAVRTLKAFDGFVAMHIAGSAWWGWQQYLNPKRDQSRLANVGSADTLGDNLAAAHLLTVIPFIFIFLLMSKDKRLRGLALIAAPLVVNLFILCNSRGGMVGLLAGGLAAFFLAKRGHRTRYVLASVLMGCLFYALADPEFITRQSTTTDYENEHTAQERFLSWQGGWDLVKSHPFGAGGEGYEVLSPIFISSVVEANRGEERAPHNTYVLVLAEWGFQGMALYLLFIGATFLMLHRVRKRALASADLGVFYRAFALQVGLVATMVASTFSDRFYGESFYWMCGLAAALYRMPDENAQEAPAVATATAPPHWGASPYAPAGATSG